MSSSTVYLITGANRPRGIGFGIVSHVLEKHENAFVYAGARNPKKATALHELETKYPGRIAVIKCVSGDAAGDAAVAKEIEERHGRVDTVIANAGIWSAFGSVSNIEVNDLEEHFHARDVNVSGPIILFQAMLALLKKSDNPRFVSMSSIGGCVGIALVTTQVPGICYGATKAALNWVTRKIHFENDWLVAFPMSPGGVSTTLLDDTCVNDPSGLFKTLLTGAEPTAAEAAVSIFKVIDESTREKNGGKFMNVDGTEMPSW